MAVSALVESSAGAGAQCRLGGTLGWSWQSGQNTRLFSICCLSAVTGIKQVCVCTLQEWSLGFLQSSVKPQWYSNQPRRLIFPMSDPRAKVPNMELKPLAP